MATLAPAAVETRPLRRSLFVATIFLGSFLLFLVQPMIARMALPRLGGSPSVWNSAMLVYQLLLLGGYAYAHALARLAPRRQAAIHLALLLAAALTLPIGLAGGTPGADDNVFLWVPRLLLLSVGPLFLAISAQAPLMQRWSALSAGGDPYPLYAASNLGSFGGLLSYPLFIEPFYPVLDQRMGWSAAYALLLVMVAACALLLPGRAPAQDTAAEAPPLPRRTVAGWIALAAIPSGLMLSTTLHLTTDIVSTPLLWVVPLGLYLLSFTVAFAARRGPARLLSAIAPVVLILSAAGVFLGTRLWMHVVGLADADHAVMLVALVALFLVSVALHAQLFDRRPDQRHLTGFYLALSVGGALGGLFGALVAPLLFDWTYEHPLWLVLAAVAMRPRSPLAGRGLWNGDAASRVATLVGLGLVALLAMAGFHAYGLVEDERYMLVPSLALIAIALVAIGQHLLFPAAIAALLFASGGRQQIERSAAGDQLSRSFFGVYQVATRNDVRTLTHGTTVHGIQLVGSPDRERTLTSYYGPTSGVTTGLRAAPALFGGGARIGIIGLGAGSLACATTPDQAVTLFEIDPEVVRIARDRFRFLARCRPDAAVVVADGRIAIERAAPGMFDILVADAFSSDSVPAHLMTREAFAAYRRALSPGGLLLVHISNRYLDLAPLVRASAGPGWAMARRIDEPSPDELVQQHRFPSDFIALSPDPKTLARLAAARPDIAWGPVPGDPSIPAWRDDHSSLLPVLKILR